MRNRDVFWNLIGLGFPLIIAVISVPRLLIVIGVERFGFLALAWGLIGYAGALDLGIGRATTHRVSELRSDEQRHQIPNLVATAIRITSVAGIFGMLVIFILALSGSYTLIYTDAVPSKEIELSVLLLGLALPMQAISATYRGVNEAFLNFKGINILRIFLGAANFGAPYLVSIFTKELYWLVATLVISRFFALIFYRYLAYQCMKRAVYLKRGAYVSHHAYDLLRLGGWFSVTSVLGPIMVQADRFFVGGLISAAAVTLYVIPYEVAIQMLIIVGAITTIMFPLISNMLRGSPQQAKMVFNIWLFRVGILMFLLMMALAYVMPILLNFWIGEGVEKESIQVGQILCLGVFFNAIGAMYFSYLHAHGKVRETAILHLIEFPLYISILIVLIKSYGLTGCAIAWVLRTGFDALALSFLSGNIKK